jgi:hypothetical protein
MKVDATYAKQQREAVAEQLPNIVPAADAARLGGLDAALVIQAAQQSSLTINRARSAAKYGPASGQVKAMDLSLQAGAQATKALQIAQTRAQLQAPTVPAGAAGIFGRVVDATGTGIRKAIVVAVNQAGSQSGKATSAVDGAYQMTLPVSGTTKSRAKTAKNASSEQSIAVHLEVLVNGKTVLTDDNTLTLQAGDIVLRELAITPPTTDKGAG